MAITGNVREYTKTYGFGLFEILGVNLSNQELKELGFYVKEGEENKEREFTSEKEGVRRAVIEFAVRCVAPNKKYRRLTFFLSDENARNKEGGTVNIWKFVNDRGEVAWSTDPKKFVPYVKSFAEKFMGTDGNLNPRPAKVGEDEFMQFMRNCMSVDFKSGGTLKYNVSKFFSGNFKELKDDLKTDFLSKIVVATTIQAKTEETGLVERESFYKYAFAPGSDYKYILDKEEYTDEDIANLKDKMSKNPEKAPSERVYPNGIERIILKMTDAKYPCQDVCYFGVAKNFVSSMNTETAQSSIIVDTDDSLY